MIPGTCASGWPSGVPGKQALQGEIVVPEFGREIPCAPPPPYLLPPLPFWLPFFLCSMASLVACMG